MKKFKILSIDGGGMKGVFPAKFLTSIEEEIGEGQIHKHFDLICGTSTGGIIALALSLGIPAKEILNLYQKNANTIFGKKRYNLFKKPFYCNKPLEKLIRDIFKKYHSMDTDPRIDDIKETKVLIPTYSLIDGATQVLKTPHATDLIIDKHIPIYMAAMATSAAPTYFNAYSNTFKRIDSNTLESFSNKVDGGVYANNPSMLGIIEARTRFEKELADIELLSLGTGQYKYSETRNKKLWSVTYWLSKKRILELFMQGQSQLAHNSISVLKKFNEGFLYKRIDLDFDQNFNVAMDETCPNKLNKLAEKASRIFQFEGKEVLNSFFSTK
ncbi:CBASS cGAMP-activated phospholipase [Arenibacter sp. ARW7G5Y1]|uniref:CBASS cGAMP-activated phospholipase n=1 Tax=Arenibacter sp. ARW7G5Y1 TaxID=2135619 RepID=UPI000D75A810|nr:CBASS cGAMP-activated phospholipase [Arenibacter sp. ARW7G5Y1]PXX30398.1 patatin-like phospholipase [Arenibacter sp. ARW7G5Y1]